MSMSKTYTHTKKSMEGTDVLIKRENIMESGGYLRNYGNILSTFFW